MTEKEYNDIQRALSEKMKKAPYMGNIREAYKEGLFEAKSILHAYFKMKALTFDEAYKLHVEMWQAMRDELGDCPEEDERLAFKHAYLRAHGYIDEYGLSKIRNNCFLCQYTGGKCSICPVVWPNKNKCCQLVNDRHGGRSRYYLAAPISEILALPVREKLPDDL